MKLRGAETDIGMYDFSNPEHPKLFYGPFGTVSILSLSPDNHLWRLTIHADPEITLPCSRIRLVVGPKIIRFQSRGVAPDPCTHLEAKIEDPSILPQVEEYFHTKIQKQPGQRVFAEFIPQQRSFHRGEAIVVRFEVTNVGDAPFTFMNGGFARMATRNNQFSFIATHDAAVVPDFGNSNHMGGIARSVTLAPGETFQAVADLTNWFDFSNSGQYDLRGSYIMRFVNPKERAAEFLWEDFATASFKISISP